MSISLSVPSPLPARAVVACAFVAGLLVAPATLLGQGAGGHEPSGHAGHQAAGDSSFAELQRRGKVAMGVDQYSSVHRFDDLPDGGRIELQRGVEDTAGVRTIREHLRAIEKAFSSGDFSTPAFVHMRHVPGTPVMAQKRAAIRYEFRELPRGGELRMTTADQDALRAVHEFLAFQRGDHRAGGTDMHGAHGDAPRPATATP